VDVNENHKVTGIRALDSVERISHAFELPGSRGLNFLRKVEKNYMFSHVSVFCFANFLVSW
jgi:hypothetical protein